MKKRLSKVTAVALAASMVVGSCFTSTAATTDEMSERELRNAQLSMDAAMEGMVLLENEDETLPIRQGTKAALFGGGSYATIKGGTGSGDVYQRYTVSVYQALNEVYQISNLDWWDSYIAGFEEGKASGTSNDYVTVIPGSFGGSATYVANEIPLTQKDIDAAKANGTDTAFYTLSRVSGEGSDREIDKGEYYLSDVERANIELLAKNFDKCVIILNVGGIVDTKFYDEIEDLDAMVLMSQAGMEGGTALANILTGKATPSGKLTDTWAENYSDYPASSIIGNADGDSLQENYEEGIFVGYRYFDSFNITPAYEFGYGLSYTDFEITPLSVEANADQVTVTVDVQNIGYDYSGKEVVEVYFSAPDGAMEKPYQELAAFAKTDELAPGESQTLTISYDTTEMSSYNEAFAAYMLEDGNYIIRVGNSSRNTQVAGVLTLNTNVFTEQVSNQLEADRQIDELSNASATPYSYETEAAEIAQAPRIALNAKEFSTEYSASSIDEDAITTYLTTEDAEGYEPVEHETVEIVDPVPEGTKLIDVYNNKVSMESFVASLNDVQLANLANGLTGATEGDEDIWGADANSVPGAAGETSQLYFNSLGIPNTVEADGPAGVRITPVYTDDEGVTHYSYCTAFPIGTLLAQTWNRDLLNQVGQAIGEEMNEFGVTLWLAPGMNIHRDPLCGRNFEYYSEDPALTGFVGSAITLGVQSNPGVGVTIKHYITNNQETSRNNVNTSVSERALREIYLKGFEMVVKSAQPMAIMSSYNKVNGTYAAENFDLLTSIPRGEWGFDGMVMTDWGAGGRASVDGMMHAGNDLVMPGRTQDRMIDALAGTPSNALDSTLVRGDIQKCVAEVLTMIMRSSQFGKMYNIEVPAHSSIYDDLATYITVNKSDIQEEDPSDLSSWIRFMESLSEEEYTPDSWAALEAALAEAKEVEADGSASREEIDGAIAKLIAAFGGLEYGVQKQHLEIAVETAQEILDTASPSDYEEGCLEALKAAIEKAAPLLTDKNATQEQVNQAASDVIDAIVSLIKDADLASLESLLEAVESLDEGKYTSDSYQALKDAIDAAREVLADPNREESDLAEAYTALADAVAGLQMRGNKAALIAVIQKAEEILANASAYTESSLNGLESVLADAKAVNEDPDAVAARINEATTALTTALTKVRLKGDIDSDGNVTTKDSSALLRYNAEMSDLDEAQLEGADVNGDGSADTKDAVLILQYASERISAF